MAGAGVNGLGISSGRAIPLAIAFGAQMRAALHHLARNTDGLAFDDTATLRSTARIGRDAASIATLAFNPWLGEPVIGPFPDIADHVIQAIAIGRIVFSPVMCATIHPPENWRAGTHLASNLPASAHRVQVHPPKHNPRRRFHRARQIPTPLRSAVACRPKRIGDRISVDDMDHRMVGLGWTARPQRLPPVRAKMKIPPADF